MVEQNANITHRPMFIVGLILVFRRSGMDLGNHGVGACNILVNLKKGSDEIVINPGNGPLRVSLERRQWFSMCTGYKY